MNEQTENNSGSVEGQTAAENTGNTGRVPQKSTRPRIIIFGAGNIGRSFIAPVFTRGGYEAVFADVAPAVLAALQERSSYTLVEKSEAGEKRHSVEPVRGVDSRNFDAVKQELDAADLCATCVGAGALPIVLKTIAKAAADRKSPLDIILAENLKGAGELARAAFTEAGISEDESKRRLGIVETSIGKMVPIMPPEVAATDPLLSWAEPFNTIIVDRDGFVGQVPEINDLMAVSPIAPWVARKLYIHNFGHAAAAYIGHKKHPEAVYIWELLEDPEVASLTGRAMHASGEALRREYPGVFTAEDINQHIDDLLFRFRNKSLGDTVYRVGRDLARKLHRRDRVVGALALIVKHALDAAPAQEAFRCALNFRPTGPDGQPDSKDAEVLAAASNPDAFITEIVGLPPGTETALRGLLMDAVK